MRVPLVLPIALVSCLAAPGCGTTVTLKNGSAAAPAPPQAFVPAPAPTATPGPSATAPSLASGPLAAGVPRASGMPHPAQGGGTLKRRTTIGDRMSSGMQTGSVGAFFGSFGGPVGFAAGGGTGFLIGFVAGQSPFGPVAGDVPTDSWEHQVEAQREWEAQVHDQLAQLDGQATGRGMGAIPPARAAAVAGVPAAQGIPQTPAGIPVTDIVAAGGADPVGDYESWSRQITTYARPAVARGPAADAASSPPESKEVHGDGATPGAPGPVARDARAGPEHDQPAEDAPVAAADTNHDGRQDAWFLYDGNGLRMRAVDRNGDGRPDQEDLYAEGRVTSRRLDDDADGRFETIETIEGDRVVGWVMDLDGDGRFESRSVREADGVHHVERDANGDGRTDAWIMMVGKGDKAAVREQVDTDGDGKPDTTTIYMDGHVVKQAGTGS